MLESINYVQTSTITFSYGSRKLKMDEAQIDFLPFGNPNQPIASHISWIGQGEAGTFNFTTYFCALRRAATLPFKSDVWIVVNTGRGFDFG
jgi:predicted nucleotidyltransferase